MHSTVFEINNDPGTVNSLQCTLIIEAGKQFLNYAVIDATHNIIAIKYYFINASDNINWYDGIEEIIAADTWLQQQYQQSMVIYSLAEQTLIPETFFDVSHNRSMLDLVHGDLQKGVTLSEKIYGWDAYNVYQVPTQLHNRLQQQFPDIKSWHHQTLALQYSDKMDSSRSDKLLVSFYHKTIMVIAIKNKALQLVQCFDYETAEDIAYYLLQTANVLDMPAATTPLYVDGMLQINSSMYSELKKYFGAIQFTQLPDGVSMPADNADFPPHFFSPLLKMMVCVL